MVVTQPKPAGGPKGLEWLYLLIGIGIIIRGVIDHGLTATELGAALFFIGLVPVGRAERANGKGGISEAMRAWLKEK